MTLYDEVEVLGLVLKKTLDILCCIFFYLVHSCVTFTYSKAQVTQKLDKTILYLNIGIFLGNVSLSESEKDAHCVSV